MVLQAMAGDGVSLQKDAIKGTITVTAGQTSDNQASANVTISGDNSRISVEKSGVVSLSAGKSIILHPGTRVTQGCFLYASIEEPVVKTGKHGKKAVKLVTIEEQKKIDEQINLAVAVALFSPFPVCGKGSLHAGDAENGSYYAGSNEFSGMISGEQRAPVINSQASPPVTPSQLLWNCPPAPVPLVFRPETTRVLRL